MGSRTEHYCDCCGTVVRMYELKKFALLVGYQHYVDAVEEPHPEYLNFELCPKCEFSYLLLDRRGLDNDGRRRLWDNIMNGTMGLSELPAKA